MFIKQGDAQPISVLSAPADVCDESTHKQLEKAIEKAKDGEPKVAAVAQEIKDAKGDTING